MFSAVNDHPYSTLRLYNFESNRDLPRHRWFPFKEGFSADLVKLAVGDLGRRHSLSLLDPFAGSGTTAVEGGYMGLPVTAVEVNPFLRFAIAAKCLSVKTPESTLKRMIGEVLAEARPADRSPLEGNSTFVADEPLGQRGLFNVPVIREFAGLQACVRTRRQMGPALELALLSALLDCCNARRDGKCLRYLSAEKRRLFSARDLRMRFQERALQVVRDVAGSDFVSSGVRTILGDSRKVLSNLDSASHDLVITSPPYLNSFDYSDVYRPELFAGGFVSSNEDLRKLRLKTLCSHVQVKRDFSEAVESKLLEPVLKRLASTRLWNKNIPAMVRTYFADMATVLDQIRRITKRGGKAWIVVSSSAYGGVEIPVDLILSDIGCQKGWKLRGVYVLRQLRSAGQQWPQLGSGAKPPLRESLIVFDR